ncbi:TldD/PmbA family protein [Amaricoccus macauensis]|uniref:TldD/PmbA family protein n=1 Tax=Amaricoccus macauensis TaxID=57001 RepID=UPI003C7ADCE3
MTQDLSRLAERLLEAAQKAGADAADAIVVAGDSLSIEVRDGGLEHAERAEGVDIGLRVFVGQGQACVSASDISETTIEEMAGRSVAMAREAPEDPFCGLADPAELASDWDIGSLELEDPGAAPSPDELKVMALEAEAAALSIDGVTKMDGAGASWNHSRIHLAASNGFSGGYARTSNAIQAVAISGDNVGMERDYAFEVRNYRSDLPTAQAIGTLAGERTVARIGSGRPPTGAWPVLFDERVASSLVGHLVQAVNGSAVARGASWLKEALGEQVLPRGMDLIEEPRRPRVSGSRPFDAEGLPVARRALVLDGVLQGWTLDLANARKLGMKSTGNAARGTSAPPSPAVSNLALTQGDKSREDLLRDMGTGLLVTGLIGSTINPNTGDYSRGASGFWVENGEITRPVNECTIAGNLRNMLGKIVAANDARAHLSRVVPSLLVEGLVIAGS